MLTDTELQRLRDDVLAALPDSCTIQRLSVSSDEGGFPTETWADVVTVACRVDPFANRTRGGGSVAERDAQTDVFRLTLPWDADIQPHDRVVYGGQTFTLAQLHDGHSLSAVRRAIITRVT